MIQPQRSDLHWAISNRSFTYVCVGRRGWIDGGSGWRHYWPGDAKSLQQNPEQDLPRNAKVVYQVIA